MQWESYKDYKARSTWYEQQEAKALEEMTMEEALKQVDEYEKNRPGSN